MRSKLLVAMLVSVLLLSSITVLLSPTGGASTTTVTANSPTGDGVAINSAISASFSEAVNESSVSIVVNGVNETPLTWSGNTTTFTPTSTWAYNTTYSVNVTGKDLTGSYVNSTWSFTTLVDAGTVQGFVQDQNNNPIANAMVMLSNNMTTTDSSGMDGLMATTDSQGTFNINNVPPGTYNVSVSESGYNTVTGTVNVTAGQTTFTGGYDLQKPSDTNWVPIIVIAALVIVAAILLAVFLVRRNRNGPDLGDKRVDTSESPEHEKETQEEKK